MRMRNDCLVKEYLVCNKFNETKKNQSPSYRLFMMEKKNDDLSDQKYYSVDTKRMRVSRE